MTTALAPHIFDGTIVVRAIDRGGDPWFVAVDVCNALGIQNARDAVSNLDEDERMTVGVSDGHSESETNGIPGFGATGQRGGARSINIISESGVYALIFRSNKPEARRFRKWITAEVIPAIRKTGSYTFAQGAEREFLLRETEEAISELQARRHSMTCELRRLEKRRRRLGGYVAPRMLSGGGAVRRYDPAVIVDLVPDDGARVSALQRIVFSATGMSRRRFYMLWAGIRDSGAVVLRENRYFRTAPNP